MSCSSTLLAGCRKANCRAAMSRGVDLNPAQQHPKEMLSGRLSRGDGRESAIGATNQERKSSPKGKFWGRMSGGRPRGYPGGRPGAKTSVKPSKSWKNKHFGADVHEPKARTSMTPGGFKKTSVRKTSG